MKRVDSKYCVDNIPDSFADGIAREGVTADGGRERGWGLQGIAGTRGDCGDWIV